jgi:hypothetical protein
VPASEALIAGERGGKGCMELRRDVEWWWVGG